MTSNSGLRLSTDDGLLRIVLDRPEKKNALDDSMTIGVADALDRAGTDGTTRCVLISAEGSDFCVGADIIARNDAAGPKPSVGAIQRRLPTLAHRLIPTMLRVQLPIVVAARGWAAGIGLNLVAAADFAVVADDARLWAPFVARGFTPDSGAAWLLPRRLPRATAMRMLLLGEELSGSAAAAAGLVHDAVPASEVDAAAAALAERLARGPTIALGLTKWLVNSGSAVSLDEHLAHEGLAIELSSRTSDFREGLAAFRERRDPGFEGR